MFRKGLVFRVIGALFLIGLIIAGGAMAFKAGEVRGVSQAPAVATAIAQAAENGQGVPVPPMMYQHSYGPGYPMYSRHHFGFFPFGICGSILFLFLLLGFIKMIFIRGMWSRGHMYEPWSNRWEGGVPPVFSEWHKRAHGEKPTEEGDKKE